MIEGNFIPVGKCFRRRRARRGFSLSAQPVQRNTEPARNNEVSGETGALTCRGDRSSELDGAAINRRGSCIVYLFHFVQFHAERSV